MKDTEILTLDFTAPEASSSGAEESVKPETSSSNIEDLLNQANTEVERAIRNFELALESGLIDKNIWQLLAYLYMGTGQMENFSSLDRRYEEAFGAPILAGLPQQKMQLDSDRVVFEMPQKIVCGSLPDIASVQEACASSKGAILDFSHVHGADTNGLMELVEFFSQLPHDQTKPEMAAIDRFISSLGKAAEDTAGTQEMWSMLFEYMRFCNDMDAFDELAIKFAVRFGISPPSW
ncbi:MAG: hypothetical protein V3S35_00585 [Nitrosomonadaceae bacterium]